MALEYKLLDKFIVLCCLSWNLVLLNWEANFYFVYHQYSILMFELFYLLLLIPSLPMNLVFKSVSWNIQNCLVKCDVILQGFNFHLKVYLFDVIHWNLLSHVAGGFITSAYRLILHLSKDFIFYFLNFHLFAPFLYFVVMLQLSFEILIDISFLFLIVIME